MLKLKLYLFLGKIGKYFIEMTNKYLMERVTLEISNYLKGYEKYQLFQIVELIPLQSVTSHEIRISMQYQNIPFSFSLEYIKGGDIERSLLPLKINKTSRVILDYIL